MNLEIEGLEELLAEVERLETVSEKLKDEALKAGAELLKKRTSEQIYSHGLNKRTGRSVEAVDSTEPMNDEVFVGLKGGKKSPHYYLAIQENGFYNVRAKRFIAPKPTFQTVYENSKGDILKEYAKVFKRGLGL